MQVAGNQLQHLRQYYHQQLNSLYGEDETEALFVTCCAHYLKLSHSAVRSQLNSHVNQSDLLKIYDAAKALHQQIPLQYILGEAWFYQLPFKVNPSVLIPRPETEELVDRILKDHPHLTSLLDLGTGSGCIPVSIKHQRPEARVAACDISDTALETAKLNAKTNAAEVCFFKYNILGAESLNIPNPAFEVVVSNPPYIKSSEKQSMHPNVLNHEPHLALFVEGEDDILFYTKIVDLCKTVLLPGGTLYFELNPLTAEQVLEKVMKSGLFTHAEQILDLSGKQRFLKASRNRT
jgi:release factor glutamine methyltransferase